MFNNLRDLMNISVVHKACTGKSGTGTKTYADSTLMCYVNESIEIVKNSVGKETVSTTKLYIDGPTVISCEDSILFNGKTSQVIAIGTFYDKGKPDIKVVYL